MKDLLNKKALAVSLPDQDGKMQKLSNYSGKYVLLYFYPKDMTTGCTIEAKCFRDSLNDLKAANIQVLGVSADTVASHKKFAEKHGLNFSLLADVDKKTIQDYGVWAKKSMFGKKYMGIERDSFLIDPKGVVVKQYQKVSPATHAAEVIKDVQSF